jgi:hypothetical protein
MERKKSIFIAPINVFLFFLFSFFNFTLRKLAVKEGKRG